MKPRALFISFQAQLKLVPEVLWVVLNVLVLNQEAASRFHVAQAGFKLLILLCLSNLEITSLCHHAQLPSLSHR